MLCCHARCVLHAMFNKPASAPSEYRHPSNGFPIMTASSPEVLFLSVSVSLCVCDCLSEVAKWLLPGSLIETVLQSIGCVFVSYPHTLWIAAKGEHTASVSHRHYLFLYHTRHVCTWKCVCVFLPPIECTDMPPWFLQTTGAERNHLSVQKPAHTHTQTQTLPNITISIFTHGQCIPPCAA